jgi:hypothetical protein
VAPTPPGGNQAPEQWIWGKFIEVAESSNVYTLVDVPFEVIG